MLLRLEIDNFALIEHMELNFATGFNILTGETGAGKSILIDAIGAILGNRIGKEFVRHDRETATITAVFEYKNKDEINKMLIENNIKPDENSVMVTREIYDTGKTFARINGKMSTLALLKDVTGNILDIHGQYENQSIFRTDAQLVLLDRFAGERVKNCLDEFKCILDEYKKCKKDLSEFVVDEEKKSEITDLLEYQINEIKNAKPKIDEDKELYERKKIISDSAKIKTSLQQIHEYLNGEDNMPALASVSQSKNILSKNLGEYPEYANIEEELAEIEYRLEDISESISEKIRQIDVYPEEAEEIEERLDLLFNLKRKYGGSIDKVLEYYKKSVEKLEKIRNSEEQANALMKKRDEIYSRLSGKALELYEYRKETAKTLEDRICEELKELGMKETEFHVLIEHEDNPENFSFKGSDSIEFLISPNPGEDLRPLSRIASGGEASRIMLAIKSILAQSDNISTLIFDEVDAGISGKTADLLGEKLKKLSLSHQILCVTHMAQIAAKSKDHFFIEKKTDGISTNTFVKKLSDKERVFEIARLLSGEANKEKAAELAREMVGMNL